MSDNNNKNQIATEEELNAEQQKPITREEMNSVIGQKNLDENKTKSTLLEKEKIKADLKKSTHGWLSKIFGGVPDVIAMYLGCLLCILLLIIVIVDMSVSYCKTNTFSPTILKEIIPILTLTLGYFFGRKKAIKTSN